MADGGSILPLQVNSTSVLVQEFTRVARPHGGQTIRRSLFPWHLALLIAAYSFVSGMMNYGSTLEVRVISFGVAGAIVLVFAFVLAYARAMSIYSLMNASLPVMLFGLLLASLMGSSNSFVVQLCVNTGNALLTAFTLVVISDCAYRFGFSAVFSCVVLRAVLMGCTLLGIASRTFLLGEPVPGSSQSIVFYLVAFAIIATAALFWFRRPIAEVSDAETGVLGAADGPTVVPMVGAAPVSDGPLASREVSEAVLDREIMRYRDMVLARCDQISQENRLSGRESEVLICLARGMSAPRIAEELVISGNTVKTHITHIYRKLGIHSRDELKVLIGVE